jgi:formate dehydrogenase maturation protein FdhE
MTSDQLILLENLRTTLHSHPEFAAHVVDAMTRGLKESATLSRNQVVDMETVASMALNTRLFKGNDKYIASLLRKWESKSSIMWTNVLEKLEKTK